MKLLSLLFALATVPAFATPVLYQGTISPGTYSGNSAAQFSDFAATLSVDFTMSVRAKAKTEAGMTWDSNQENLIPYCITRLDFPTMGRVGFTTKELSNNQAASYQTDIYVDRIETEGNPSNCQLVPVAEGPHNLVARGVFNTFRLGNDSLEIGIDISGSPATTFMLKALGNDEYELTYALPALPRSQQVYYSVLTNAFGGGVRRSTNGFATLNSP